MNFKYLYVLLFYLSSTFSCSYSYYPYIPNDNYWKKYVLDNDKNKNGLMEISELDVFIKDQYDIHKFHNLIDSKMKVENFVSDFISSINLNNDKSITDDEFLHYKNLLYFKYFLNDRDKNGDKKLGKSEMKDFFSIHYKSKVKKLNRKIFTKDDFFIIEFAKYDLNNNEQIDFEEVENLRKEFCNCYSL